MATDPFGHEPRNSPGSGIGGEFNPPDSTPEGRVAGDSMDAAHETATYQVPRLMTEAERAEFARLIQLIPTAHLEHVINVEKSRRDAVMSGDPDEIEFSRGNVEEILMLNEQGLFNPIEGEMTLDKLIVPITPPARQENSEG